jgi:molybdate transport system substrate-binding protein
MRLALLSLLLLASCAQKSAVQVFAAASLTDALTEIGARYERESGQRVVFNFGASSTLARQIGEGAPADLFLSADEAKVNQLEVVERASVLSNTLVIVGAGLRSPRDLIGKRIALAEPSTVPAGIYAKQYLVSMGLWDAVAPNVVPAENVRAALAAVDAGNVDAAIVYKTDARRGFAFEIPREAGPRISYVFALLTNERGPRDFFAYLRREPALATFRKHGFLIQ